MQVYLDNNATSMVSPSVREAMMPFFGEFYGNASSTHILSFEGQTPEFFTGNYAEFEAYRQKRDGDDLVAKRQKYRKIGN